MIDKQTYGTLNDRLPIFFKSWWLDAVCEGGEWYADVHTTNDAYDSIFVYFMKRKYGIDYIVMPPLTQYLGEYSLLETTLSQKKQISNYYIDNLPNTAFTSICMSHKFNYWSPYMWRGYSQTSRYSLKINNLSNIDEIFAKFDNSKQRNIKKAKKLLLVESGMAADDFYTFFQNNEKAQGSDVSYSRTMFLNLHKSCIFNNSGQILYARDSKGEIYGALFVVWDFDSMYALTYSFPVKYRNSGVGDLLMYEAIKLAQTVTKSFDFEGSMVENIEQSYRRFGSEPSEYYQISKINNKLFKIVNHFKSLI